MVTRGLSSVPPTQHLARDGYRPPPGEAPMHILKNLGIWQVLALYAVTSQRAIQLATA